MEFIFQNYHHSLVIFYLFFIGGRERSLQEQLRQATESVKNMQKLHESAQSQLFELRTQSGRLPDQSLLFLHTVQHICFL